MEKEPTSLQILSRVKEIKSFDDSWENMEKINKLLKQGWIIIATSKSVLESGGETSYFYLARLNDASPLQKQ